MIRVQMLSEEQKMDRVQCTSCKRQKFVSDFLKNGKTLKTCITCRAPRRSVTVDTVQSIKKTKPVNTVDIAVDIALKPVETPIEIPLVDPVPRIEPVIEPIHTSIVKNQWRFLSGKWIHRGEERQLHERLLKKMNREFLERSAFAVHKYLTRRMMADIRDL